MEYKGTFEQVFRDKFPKTDEWKFNRYGAFKFITDELLKLGRPVTIVETGVMRNYGNFSGDGNSSIIFDWVLNKVGGNGLSIDINEDVCKHAREHLIHMRVINSDSITALRGLLFRDRIDCLFLDSFDLTAENHPISALHHVAELGCIYSDLPKGCLVCVDDKHSETFGKDTLVHEFFKLAKVRILYDSYLCIWKKS